MKFIAENPLLFIVLTTIVIMAIMFAIDTLLSKKKLEEAPEEETKEIKHEVKAIKLTPKTAYSDLMNILNSTIDRELYFWLQLNVNMKDVKIIDFDETMDSISRRIYNALSPEFVDDLNYYHNERWIMEYIVRTVKIYITEYIRSHPVS